MRGLTRVIGFWRKTTLFGKTFTLSLMLALGVALMGEGSEWLLDIIPGYKNLPGSDALKEAALWLIVIVVTAVIGSYFLSRVTTGAIKRLNQAVVGLSRGEMGTRIQGDDPNRGDEVGELARGFNQMADRISAILESEHRLLRDISHEMRSPLARLKIALALLEKKVEMSPPKTADDYLKQMDRDIGLIDEMVCQLLEQARLEVMSKVPLEKTDIDLSKIVAASAAGFALNNSENGKSVTTSVPESLPYVGNEVLLRRICDNLIKNALYYTAAGTEVTVRLKHGFQSIVLTVEDHGPGVDEEHLQKIFRPFYRAESARDRASGGFGLGLAIVRQGVDLHGGKIEARNKPAPDRGLIISAVLPAAPDLRENN